MAPKVQHEYAATHQRARIRWGRPWLLRRSFNWSRCGSRHLGRPPRAAGGHCRRVPVPPQHGGGRLTATSGVLHTSTCLPKPSLARHHAAEYAQHATLHCMHPMPASAVSRTLPIAPRRGLSDTNVASALEQTPCSGVLHTHTRLAEPSLARHHAAEYAHNVTLRCTLIAYAAIPVPHAHSRSSQVTMHRIRCYTSANSTLTRAK